MDNATLAQESSGDDERASSRDRGTALPPDPVRELSAAEIRFADAFTRVMSVLMKSEPYRSMRLGEIEHFVAPPLISGQFAILDGRINGHRTPLAIAFWAHVSPEVDKRLSDTSQAAVLMPQDWRSGTIPWLIDVVGQPEAAAQLMRQLKERPFAELVKMRHRAADGHLVVSSLQADS